MKQLPAAELSPTVNYKKRLTAKPAYAAVSLSLRRRGYPAGTAWQ
jgi:hypothetical protein